MADITLDDFRRVLTEIAKVGPRASAITLEGMGLIRRLGRGRGRRKAVAAERAMRRLLGIIDAMTPEERRSPFRVIDASRRRRIADGAGFNPVEIAKFVKKFNSIAALRKRCLRRRRPESD